MNIVMTTKTSQETVATLAKEFNRQLDLVREESVRATTVKESRYYAGRISQLHSVVEFLTAIKFE